MNDSILLAAASACWLGILTSISPCPLATNIAAISYLGKRVSRPSYVIATGAMYTLGRTVTYVIVAALIIGSVLAVPKLSFFLQRNTNIILGPILIVTGVFLLGVFRMAVPGIRLGDRMQRHVEHAGIWGAAFLGIVFALAFCPVSAALFFGGLLPVAIERESPIIFPMLYGIGTALPVVVFAILLAFGTRYVGRVFDRLAQFELWARKITAMIFVAVGIYLIAGHVL